MALPSSGPLSISQIRDEEVNNGGFASSYSLRQLSANAGKSTPDSISEFYGYAAGDADFLLSLDAANGSSYGGSGTTWYDISGKGNNATLTKAQSGHLPTPVAGIDTFWGFFFPSVPCEL